MSLKYTKFEDVCLKPGSKITLNALNTAFKKLIENDNSLIPEQSIIPKIWECTWFNDNTIEGYKKGDAVWLNTEPLDAFTSSRYQSILEYLLASPYYRQKVKDFQQTGNQAALYMLCRNMVQSGKIFYIGDLEKPVQLKISLVDNNKDLPLETSTKWKDFFILTDNYTNYQKFMSILAEQTDELLDLHIKTYHIPENFPIDNYLLRDFSNIDQEKIQRCKNIKFKNNMSGFDYVLLFAKKKYAGQAEKWFRIWNSGYIEQGGTVDLSLDSNRLPEGDIKEEHIYTVNLAWHYGAEKNQEAPTFEYEPIDFRDMYCTVLSSDFGTGKDDEKIIYDLKDMISLKTRYVVSLSPIEKSGNVPYSSLDFPQTLDIYQTNAAASLSDKSFMIYFQPNDGGYMYYCSGFSTTMFDRVRQQTSQIDTYQQPCECK